jgi:hypothetical protein
MRIKCIWDYGNETDKCLEIGLSLVNDRLFIRVTESNLDFEDYIASAKIIMSSIYTTCPTTTGHIIVHIY